MNDSPGVRVLVVDDEPSIRTLITRVLERNAFRVANASDGQAAVEMLADGEYAAAVLDLTMPRQSGFDVINALKKRRPSSLRGLVVVSAVAREMRASDMELVYAILRKPFELADVVRAVQACLDRADEDDA